MEGVSVVKAASQVCVVGTEHELVADAAGGVYAPLYDLSPLVAGDTVQMNAYVRVVAGGPWLLVDQRSYSNVQTVPAKDLDGRAIVGPYGARFGLKQTAGTARTVGYVITKVSP